MHILHLPSIYFNYFEQAPYSLSESIERIEEMPKTLQYFLSCG